MRHQRSRPVIFLTGLLSLLLLLPCAAKSPPMATFIGPAWTGGVVPFRFDPALTTAQQDLIELVFAEIEAMCGARFVPRTFEPDYVTLRPSVVASCPANCSFAGVGMRGGEQFVEIGSNHFTARWVLVHELLHTLGFLHEHQRPDRDNFIVVNWQRISQTLCTGPCNFAFAIDPAATAYGAYDFDSIMHYGTNNFSDGSGPTIQTQPAFLGQQGLLGGTDHLTALDIAGLQTVYGPPPAPVITGQSLSLILHGVNPTTMTLTGENFFLGNTHPAGFRGSRVTWDGMSVSETVLDPETIEIALTPSLLSAGCHEIVVHNDAPAGGDSNTIMVTVVDLRPQVDAFYGHHSDERTGAAVAGVEDLDGDGLSDAIVGAPGAVAGNGRVSAYSGATGALIWVRESGFHEGFGAALANVGDVDGDGFDDVLAGAPEFQSQTGRVVLLSGIDGTILRARSGLPGDRMGASVASAGDLDGDGVAEHLVGAPGHQNQRGAVRVYAGQTGFLMHNLLGSNVGDGFGWSVAGGYDLGGTSHPDFAVGAPFAGGVGPNVGAVHVFSGADASPLTVRNGTTSEDRLGHAVAVLPSVSWHRGGTLVAGAPQTGNPVLGPTGAGYVRVYRDAAFGFTTLETLSGTQFGDAYGSSLANLKDVDQDGYGDFAVGAVQHIEPFLPTGRGYVQVYSGRELRRMDSILGGTEGSRFGTAVSDLSDSDGDGRADLLVGGPGYSFRCPDAGRAVIEHPPVPPAPFRTLITEVSTGEPDAVELTHYGTTGVRLDDWRVIWETATNRYEASLSGFLNPGETLVIQERGAASLANLPPRGQVVVGFPPIATGLQALRVQLRSPNDLLIDEVRIADHTDQYTAPTSEGGFRGLALRHGVRSVFERAGPGLDANCGEDWAAAAQHSMGRENTASGPRGSDPEWRRWVYLSQIDDDADYIQIHKDTIGYVDMQNWYLLASGSSTNGPVLIRPFPEAPHPDPFVVIGDSANPPAEIGGNTQYIDLSAIGGGNIPLGSGEFTLALYDSYGRCLDLVRTVAESAAEVVHNNPRLPAERERFFGAAPRTRLGDRALGRLVYHPVTSHGGQWQALETRRMGHAPNVSHFTGNPGHADLLGLRAAVDPWGGVTAIVDADLSLAGHTYGILLGSGHLRGAGPIFGLAGDAVQNWMNFGQFAPFSGTLDAEASARFDLDLALPPGLRFDLIAFTLDGQALSARTLIVEFDS